MRPRRITVLLVAGTSLLLAVAGCAAPGRTPGARPGISQAVVRAPAAEPCPTLNEWSGRPAPLPSSNTPQADELADALGAQGRGSFAGVYGTLIVDFPAGRVALCVTDVAEGRKLAAAAKRADPGIDLSRLDLYQCRYSEHALDAAMNRLTPLMSEKNGFPIYSISPTSDNSGLQVTTTRAGADSGSLRLRLTALVGGIPVTLTPGSAAVAA